MIDYVEWVRNFITHYPALQYFVIFFGAAFGGEVALITLSFLAAQNFFPFFTFFLISYLGTLSSDSLWFLLGRTKLAIKIIDYRHITSTVVTIMEAIHKISRGNHLLAFIFAKFLIGTRVVLILYIAKTNITFKNFIRNDSIAIFVWLVVLIPIGFLSGLGFTYISSVLENVYAGIGFVVLILFIVVIMQLWLKNFFTKEGEEILEEQNML